MPESMIKPLDYPGTAIICPHPTLRNYIPYKKFSEVDPEYYLVPAERRPESAQDDLTIRNDQSIDLNTRFLTTNNINVTTQELPGNVGVRSQMKMPHEISKLI